MAVYMIIDIAVCNKTAKGDYLQYLEKVRPIVEQYGGRYLVRGGTVTPIVGDWHPERIILIEFPSAEHVKQWWTSPEYKAIAILREQATQAKAIIVEGCNG